MASSNPSTFSYPPFPKGADSLRVLTLLPKETSQEAKSGTEDHDHVACELIPRTFASKPVYECLSYTWGTQPANKNITVNGQHFLVRENLFNALRQLRRGETRPLWVDAICISQADIQERNAQYTEADKEVSYIQSDKNRKAIANHPYWRRAWIIQEVVLAQEVVFIHGNLEIKEGYFERMLDAEYNTLEKHALPLLKHRDRKDIDEYRLETLIDKFKGSQCMEVRDKVFSLLGMANDVDEEDGGLEVDYEVGLFELYRRLLDFHQRGAPLWEGHFVEVEIKAEVDRAVRLMKFSSLIQNIFEGGVEADAKLSHIHATSSEDSNNDKEKKFYYARGDLAGEILYIGPTYSEIVSSHSANKTWKRSIGKLYASASGEAIRDLRQDDQQYSNLILDWNVEYLKRIRKVESRTSFGFRLTADDEDILPELDQLNLSDAPPEASETEINISSEPRRFLATNSRIGFAPPGTQVGDLVYQFLGCKVAVVLRKFFDEVNDRWKIIGKADLSQMELREDWSQKISPEALNLEVGKFAGNEDSLEDWGFKEMMNFKMDIETLQKLSY